MMGESIGGLPVIEARVIPGHSHELELEEVEDAIRSLDFDAPDYEEQHAELIAQRRALRAMPAEPDRVTEQETGETVAERWAGMDDAERRDYLLRAGAKAYVAGKDPAGWRLDVERPNVLRR
jgi:hypothetical protein